MTQFLTSSEIGIALRICISHCVEFDTGDKLLTKGENRSRTLLKILHLNLLS